MRRLAAACWLDPWSAKRLRLMTAGGRVPLTETASETPQTARAASQTPFATNEVPPPTHESGLPHRLQRQRSPVQLAPHSPRPPTANGYSAIPSFRLGEPAPLRAGARAASAVAALHERH